MYPAIVKVATGVTSRIVEPSTSFTEADLDQIMSVPNYIYFEEHHPVSSYFKLFGEKYMTNGPAFLREEVKDEGANFSSNCKKPATMVNNFFQDEDVENKNPNRMIDTSGKGSNSKSSFGPFKKQSAALSAKDDSKSKAQIGFHPSSFPF